MAKTIEEYRKIIDEGGFRIAFVEEGWENLIDNLIDYDGIKARIDSDDPAEEARAWAERDEEERKAGIALREYLESVIKEYASKEGYFRNVEEAGI